MYDVLDICKYIIKYSNFELNGISNLKLQKVLYLLQAYFLQQTKKLCFKEKIEAWSFGPVIPKAYCEYKQFGALNIPYSERSLVFRSNSIWSADFEYFDENVIAKKHRKLIEKFLTALKDYSATELVEITHNQDPWLYAYEKGKNNEIKIEAIRSYFNV